MSIRSTLIVLVALSLGAHTSQAEGLAIRGAVKGTDGKPLAGAEIRAQRADNKGSVVTTTTNAKGEFGFSKLTESTYKVTAVINKIPKSVAVVKTHNSGWSRVDFDLGAAVAKGGKQKRKVWVQGETGSRIGGRWIEVDDPNAAGSAGTNPVERIDGTALRNQNLLDPRGGRSGP